MIFVKIFITIVSILAWVLGAKAATQCTYNSQITDFLFAIPILPMLFKEPDHSNSPKMYALLGIFYGIAISGIICLFSF
jgi:hypothetical protein